MNVIGISGKIGCGKTTLANLLVPLFPGAYRISFFDLIKWEMAAYLGLPVKLTHSEVGKKKLMALHLDRAMQLGRDTAAVCEMLQRYCTDFRCREQPDYWLWAMGNVLSDALKARVPAVVIDDVRFREEAHLVQALTHGWLFRVDPYPAWRPGRYADHASETDLDDYDDWDGHYRPLLGELPQLAHEILGRIEARA